MAPQSTELPPKKTSGVAGKDEIALGRFLANPATGEEVVVTGIAGQFPNSQNVEEFRYNLLNKIDMVSEDTARWEHTHPEIPKRGGKIHRIDKFDAGFFGLHHRQAHAMDPMARNLLENAIECIIDAGLNPSDLEGTNCGVFVGSCFAETEKHWFFEQIIPKSFAMTGCERSMVAHRVSYYLKLNGPSFICDTACSSSLYALEQAYRAIRCGDIDLAIVGGTNVCLHPFVSLQFARLGVLSPDGKCKCFDSEGDGYARSEAMCSLLLQKAKDAKRIYCQVVHAKTNCDGYKEQGITYPSGEMQKRLLMGFYEECGLDPTDLSFLEAHGTGTKVGDPEEANAIDEVFCTNRKTPLLMGSVKSSIGHSEPSSGLCSVIKAIIAFETGFIPPNIHYNKPREGIAALESGRMKVVTEKTPFQDDRNLIGINSFGFGGANCHVVVKGHTKAKQNNGLPRDNLPRLICVSARVPEGISSFLDYVNSRKLDTEYIRLLHNVFRKDILGHMHRGYTVVSKSGEITRGSGQYFGGKEKLYFGFGGIDNSWHAMGNDLFKIPLFAASIQKVHNILSQQNINITEILLNKKKNLPVYYSVLGNLAVQIGIVDLLKTIELTPDGVFGYSTGELACAYFDEVLTLEETVISALIIASAFKSNSEPVAHVVAKISKEKIKQLPNGIEITGTLSADEVLISGSPDVMALFVKDLKNKQVKVTDAGVAYTDLKIHNIERVKSQLIEHLQKVIPKPRTRSEKWISFSHEKLVSSEHIINSLVSPCSFNDLLQQISIKSVVLEIGSGQITKILQEGLDYKKIKAVHFNQEEHEDKVVVLLSTLGRVYNYGYNFHINRIYPTVQYPVGRGTPLLSNLVKWDHSVNWYVYNYTPKKQSKTGARIIGVAIKGDDWKFITGHLIDGRNLFPASGYLTLVWETFALMTDIMTSDMHVAFENVKFNRATYLGKSGRLEFTVMIQKGSGKFEVSESGSHIVTGRIGLCDPDQQYEIDIPVPPDHLDEAVKMTTKDIYKDLRLRGYNYNGKFRGLVESDLAAEKGLAKWDGNWVTYMDTMFQMKILQIDSRFLYVPTAIDRLTIDGKKHIQYSRKFGEDPALPVYVHKDCNIIRSGGIEVRGLQARSITRRKPLGEPVLEKYIFIPNETKLTLNQSMRVIVQMCLENVGGYKVKAVEVIDELTKEGSEPLSPLIHEALGDLPLIQPNISIFTKKQMKLSNIIVEDKKLVAETDCTMVVATNILSRALVLQQAFNALKPNGFVISREAINIDVSKLDTTGIDIVNVHKCEKDTLVVLKKPLEYQDPAVIDVTDSNYEFSWLPHLQDAVKNDTNIIVLSQNDPLNGAIGLVNCLRREPGGSNIKCFFIVDPNAPKFNIDHPFYSDQVKKNLGINVFKDGQWGTYRHLLLENISEVEAEHGYVNVMVRGDFSSFRCVEGPLSLNMSVPEEKLLVAVYYASINFRDVMTAAGKINSDVITMDRTKQECIQGIEYSGKTLDGRRVMGVISSGACASLVSADTYFIYDVPDAWTLEEAATVPVVYSTVYVAFLKIGGIRRGQSVLIHSGAGGIGQAAIHVALYFGCKVYTTVGTPEKREFIKETFPQLTDRHIGNSRDTSFEQLIFRETKGRGVDYVLNSLAEEKLLASARCLAKGGKFLEIGKFDLASNNELRMLLLDKQASFHGIMLDMILFCPPTFKAGIYQLLLDGIKNGYVKPLKVHSYKVEEVEQAFRFMASGKHMGKVVLCIRKEERDKFVPPKPFVIKCLPRYYANENYTYVICGGLGGFGLELADWLVLRGAKNLVLTSRTGVKTGYQSSRISVWNSYGASVVISTADITTRSGCEQLLKEASKLGPVHGIFNLAVVLRDALLENQTIDNYKVSFAPKALATKYLDEVSRDLCPQLRDFVIFSSVSCGRGNAGQTNYGMANSIMERIIERRQADGLPALAIEWGAIGDVGLVAEMQENHTELEIGGTLQQRISSCLQTLDVFMKQKSAIVSSMVVAEKRAGAGGADNIVDTVANILGLNDLKTISLHVSLAELGMDSITAVEIKQTLEREFDVVLTAQDIRGLTFARLQELEEQREAEQTQDKKKDRLPGGIELILRLMGDEASCNVPMIRLPSKVKEEENAPSLLILPGLEGVASVLKPLASNLNCHALVMQFCHDHPEDSLNETAAFVLQNAEKYLTPGKPFTIAAYSFGCSIAMEMVGMLERKGYSGTLLLIDGAPKMLFALLKQQIIIDNEDQFQTAILCGIMSKIMPYEGIMRAREPILKCSSYEERMRVAREFVPKDTPHSPEHQKVVAVGAYKKLKGLMHYQPSFIKLKSKVKLFKPKHLSVQGLPEDYGLSELCHQPVEVTVFSGNHISLLENVEMAEAINAEVGARPLYAKETVLKDEAGRINLQSIEVKQI